MWTSIEDLGRSAFHLPVFAELGGLSPTLASDQDRGGRSVRERTKKGICGGHGHLGLDDFMARRLGWERPISDGGATWIHFGPTFVPPTVSSRCNRGATTCAS